MMPNFDCREDDMSDSGRVLGDGRYAGPPKTVYDLRCSRCGAMTTDPDKCTKVEHGRHNFVTKEEALELQEMTKRDAKVDMTKHKIPLPNFDQGTSASHFDEIEIDIRLKNAIGDFLIPYVDKEAIENTPGRFVSALKEMTSGYAVSPEEVLGKVFEDDHDQIIILKSISFHSLCEHHLLPFSGTCDIGYLPGKVVGLSKLARLVDCYSRRLQIQERMTRQISDAIVKCLDARGVAVVTKAVHSCMTCRGVMKQGSTMVCSSMVGVFREEASARAEFLQLCQD